MKLSTRLKLLIILSAIFAVCLFAGCKIGDMTMDEYLEKNEASGQCVTYFANDNVNLDPSDKANVNGKDKFDVYYKAQSYIIATNTANNFSVTRSNYTFVAWYYIDVDDNGEPYHDSQGNVIYDESKKVLPTDKIQADQHLYVVAVWSRNVSIEVYLASDFDLKDSAGNVIGGATSETPLATVSFGTVRPGDNFTLSARTLTNNGVNPANATFVYFFADAQCIYPISSVKMPEEDDAENVKIYAKFVEGEWNIVSTASDVSSMFNATSGNYYLFSTTLDSEGKSTDEIDCTGRTFTLKSGDFDVVIEGNGTTLSNLTFSRTGASSIQTGSFAPFGKLTSSSRLSNLTLKNVSVEYSVRSNSRPEVYMFCIGADQGASFENFAIDGITLSPSSQSDLDSLYNVQGDYDFLLFGGFDSDETDEDFLRTHDGITVKNIKVKVGNNTIFEK